MLAELAAANAAFQVIKQAVSNGKDIAAAGSAIAKFVGAKQDLERKSIKKGGGSDLEELANMGSVKYLLVLDKELHKLPEHRGKIERIMSIVEKMGGNSVLMSSQYDEERTNILEGFGGIIAILRYEIKK